MRSGVEIWIEDERAKVLQRLLPTLQSHKFVDFDERTLNTADLTGIFTVQDMADLTNRKNGRWQCKKSEWHDRNEECDCWKEEKRKKAELIKITYTNCGKCQEGYVLQVINGYDKMMPCECIKTLLSK